MEYHWNATLNLPTESTCYSTQQLCTVKKIFLRHSVTYQLWDLLPNLKCSLTKYETFPMTKLPEMSCLTDFILQGILRLNFCCKFVPCCKIKKKGYSNLVPLKQDLIK